MNHDDQDLSSLIQQHATRHAAPDTVRAGIRTQIALVEAGRAAPPAPPAPAETPRPHGFSFSWRTASVSFALGLACALVILPMLQRLDLNTSVDAELVSGHVRAMQLGPLFEVASTDRHTVKPWFQGRLDYAPPVFDLSAEGFLLTGGRVEHVRGSAVATLVYTRKQHVIDVFVWPSAAQIPPVRSLHKGFGVLHWADGSMQYWAVSDLERAEIERFAQLWQDRAKAL